MTDQLLPEPLVPAEVDLSDFAFMPVDTDRLIKSETWVLGTGDEKAAAFTLWAQSWHQVPAGSLPDSDRMLEHLSQSKRWKAVKAHALRGWVACSDGRLYHPVVCEKVLEAWLEKLVSAINGAEGNAKRWGTEVDTKPMRRQFVDAVERLRLIDPASRTFKKKAIAVLLATSHPESGGDAHVESGGDITPSSPPDRNRQGQGQGQGFEEKETTAPSVLVDRTADAAADDPTTDPPDDDLNPAPGLPGIAPPSPKPKAYAVPDCPYDALLTAYHELLPVLPKANVLNDARRGCIRARWREVCAEERYDAEQGVEWFRWLFRRVARSQFLTGRGPNRNNGRPWRATFDWLFAPTNFAKVVDGNYTDERTTA